MGGKNETNKLNPDHHSPPPTLFHFFKNRAVMRVNKNKKFKKTVLTVGKKWFSGEGGGEKNNSKAKILPMIFSLTFSFQDFFTNFFIKYWKISALRTNNYFQVRIWVLCCFKTLVRHQIAHLRGQVFKIFRGLCPAAASFFKVCRGDACKPKKH